MTAELRKELESAITPDVPLEEIVGLLRQYRARGVTQQEVYSFLEALRATAPDDATGDRILEVADFVRGFCSPHMRIWDS
jgi:anthranilate phosphoribosyltransferase